MDSGLQSLPLSRYGRSTFRDRGWVLLAIVLLLSSLLTYAAARPASALAVVGDADATRSTITAAAAAITVDGSATITVQLNDELGDPLTTGGDVVTLASDIGSVTSPSDNGDGSYSATLTSQDVGLATVTGIVNRVAITDDATVDFAVGVASAMTSTIASDVANMTVDDSATITVTLLDQYSNSLTTGGDVVTLASDIGSVTSPSDNGDGSYSATLTSQDVGLATVTGIVNSVAITDDATVDFAVGAASATTSTITATSTSPNVDVGSTTITVEIFDQYGNALTVGGDTVTLVETGVGALSTVTDNLNGTYSATLSSTATGLATISGVVNSGNVVDEEAVTFQPGALESFTIAPIVNQTAGASFNVSITAYDQYDNAKTDYDGGALSGLLASPGCAGCSPAIAAADPTYGLLDWDNGTVITSATAVKAQAVATLVIADGAVSDGESFDVAHSAVLGGVTIDAITGKIAGTGFTVTVRAFDAFGNVKLDQTGGSLTGLLASPGCAGCSPAIVAAIPTHGAITWTGIGVGTASVTAVNAQVGATITATVGAKSNTSIAFTVTHSATLAGFAFDTTIGTQTAGAGFNVVVTAYDPFGNVKADNASGALSNLATSPGCPTPTCSPALPATAATYGTASWSGGSKTFTGVIAYKAQAGATIKITDGLVGNTSNAFTVRGAAAAKLFFAYPPSSFDGRPIDTKLSQPIYQTCVPAAPGAANPCGAGSASVTVLAIDAYGNRAGATTISVRVTPTSPAVNVATGTTTPGVAPYGEAAYTNNSLLATATAQGLTLVATASGATSASSSMQAVNDLEACDGGACDNNTSNAAARLQKAFGKISTTSDFYDNGVSTNVRLTTQFVAGSQTNQCGNLRTIGDATDLRVDGLGVGGTAPDTTMVMVMPKDTLKAYGISSRGTSSFNVCLGALNISAVADPITPWLQKNMTKGAALKPSERKMILGETRYWGIPANCGTAGLAASDPCIGLRSKQAATVQAYLGMTNAEFALLGISDADMVIIIQKKSPWDGKAGMN